MGTQRQGSGKTRVTCRSNAPKPLWNYSYVGCPVAIRSSVLHRLFDSPSGGIMRWYQIFMVVSIREVMRMTWDLNALWTCTNRMNSVVSQTMLPMQRKYHIKRDSMESYYHMLMQTPLFSSLSSDELPHMLNCLQARQKSYIFN